ncbi:MAG: MFS transporter [Alphaproteobacteria bacterium]|nr:MFS transporter [Alphaproteobacteria bacterium]
MTEPAPSHVLGHRDFRLFLGARFAAGLAMQMQAVAIGWYLYDLTGDPMTLGYAGLAVFLPVALLTLPAGDVSDRVDRRWILGRMHLTLALCATILLGLTATATAATGPFYAVLALSGMARAFSAPAIQSFTPFLVPRTQFANAVAWSSSASQTATILGPALGGFLYLFGPTVVFAACLAMSLLVASALVSIRTQVAPAVVEAGSTALSRTAFGLRYVWRQPIVLGAISLDMFAVLLGGVTALLPVFARDILGVGPDGLGLMRSSVAAGAVSMALLLATLPAARHPHAGLTIFLGVALFGAAILVFGLSTSFVLSLVALFVMGLGDMASVFVRSTVVQLAAPDEMRGRVSAVYMLFVGASNELGEFRAGLAAAWLGAVPAVLLGGASTLAVVALWAWLFPGLRRIDRLADVAPRPGS